MQRERGRETERERERGRGRKRIKNQVEKNLFRRIDIETAKIVRFFQFKLCCEANNKKI